MQLTRRRVAAGRAWWSQSLGGAGLRRVRELDLDTRALALGAQQLLCTAPLIVAISAVVQHSAGHGVGYATARFFDLDGYSADAVIGLFARSSTAISDSALVFSLIIAVVFATGVASVQQRTFELMWTLPAVSGTRAYLRQLVWTPTLALFSVGLLIVSRVGTFADEHVPDVGGWIVVLVRGVLIVAFYWWSQFWLLDGRVTRRALLPGAVAVATLTLGLLEVSRLFIAGQFSWQVHAYGQIGCVFVLSVWLMDLSMLTFVGVLIGALVAERHSAPDNGSGGRVSGPLTMRGLDSLARARIED